MKVKILITIYSFEPKYLAVQANSKKQQAFSDILVEDGMDSTKKVAVNQQSTYSFVALPKKRSLYTVLRSPHIDKKSRDQFEMTTWKQLVSIHSEIRYLQEQLFHLKFHNMPGTQMKVRFQTKTRLHFF